jgi:hypothetical protein
MATSVTLTQNVPTALADELGLAAGAGRQTGAVLSLPPQDAAALVTGGYAAFNPPAGAVGASTRQSRAIPGSTANLAASVVFTGNGIDVGGDCDKLRALAFSDVAGTLFVEQAAAVGGPWRPTPNGGTPVAAGAVVTVEVPAVLRFARLRYVNGAAAQTAFQVAGVAVPLI